MTDRPTNGPTSFQKYIYISNFTQERRDKFLRRGWVGEPQVWWANLKKNIFFFTVAPRSVRTRCIYLQGVPQRLSFFFYATTNLARIIGQPDLRINSLVIHLKNHYIKKANTKSKIVELFINDEFSFMNI